MRTGLKAVLTRNFDSRNSFANAAERIIGSCTENVSKVLQMLRSSAFAGEVALTPSVGSRVSAMRGASESVGRPKELTCCGSAGRSLDNYKDNYSIRVDNMSIQSEGRLRMLNPLTNEFIDVNPANFICMPPPLMSEKELCGFEK